MQAIAYRAIVSPSPESNEYRGAQFNTRRAFAQSRVLIRNLFRSLIQNDGFEMGFAHEREDVLHDLEYRVGSLRAEVECFACQRCGRHHFGGRQVGLYRVADIEVVASKCAVAPDDRRLTEQRGADGAGDQPVVVEVAGPPKIAASRDDDGCAVSMEVRQRDRDPRRTSTHRTGIGR